jgi:hypothetical protein
MSNNNNSKFIDIGYVSESKKSKAGESEKTYMLTINPMDKAMSGIQLNRGAKILLRAPKQGKNQSPEDFEKLKDWKLFSAVLIQDDSEES